MTTQGARRWWLPGLLSFALPGLGQLYNGRFGRAAVFFALPQLSVQVFAFLVHARALKVALALVFVSVAIQLACIVEAAVDGARGAPDPAQRPQRPARFHVAVLVAGLAFVFAHVEWVRHNQLQAFRIPSASGAPALLPGDYVFVDRRESARDVSVGDLAAYRYPPNPSLKYIHRVVAVGGDVIALRDRRLFRNGRAVAEPWVVHTDPNLQPAEQGPRDNFGPRELPANALFVMGDNRDNSHDGRYWGPVDRALVLGTATAIYFSWDASRRRVRWERIGMLSRPAAQ